MNKTKNIVIAAVIIALCGGLAGGLFYWRRTHSSKNIQKINPPIEESENDNSSTKNVETSILGEKEIIILKWPVELKEAVSQSAFPQPIIPSGKFWARNTNKEAVITRINGLNFYIENSDSSQYFFNIPYGSKIQIDKIGALEPNQEIKDSSGVWCHGIWQNKKGWFYSNYALEGENLRLFNEDPYHWAYFEGYSSLNIPDKINGYDVKIFNKDNLPSPINARMPNDPNVGIDKIRAKIVYFRTNDFETAIYSRDDILKKNWFKTLDDSFKRIAAFHKKEFLEKSTIKYDIYPKIVTGKYSDKEYSDNYGINSSGPMLTRIISEIKEKIFSPDGKYYDKNFISTNANEYPILVVIFETNVFGGVAAEQRAVVSASTLNSKNLSGDTSNIEYFIPTLYHEMLHTIGLADEYWEGSMDIAKWGESIMSETKSPLELNYVSGKIKDMIFGR